jgi:hypothetical protein
MSESPPPRVLLRNEQSDARVSGAPARYLLVCAPAGCERELARRAADRAGVDPPECAMQPIPEVTVVGPRIRDRHPRQEPSVKCIG